MEIRPVDEVAREVALGVLALEDIRVGAHDADTDREMTSAEASLRQRFLGCKPSEIDELAPARRLYRAAGIDPTRYRPSSEALVRRVLKGSSLPRINAAVDLGNLAAVVSFLPLGLYDIGRLKGGVRLRRGREGESYAGIRKERVGLSGRLLLEDDAGPFGNPSSDSTRTALTLATTRLLWVYFAPPGYPRPRLAAHVEWARARAVARLGGTAAVHLSGP